MVYYRKYRPQTIGELDSKKLQETLFSVLGGNSIPHAFLFTGPKGLGKTSTARIVAKAVNCTIRTSNDSQITTNKKTKKSEVSNQELAVRSEQLAVSSIEPCNDCDQCISITNGSNLDVLEIDGASNRGIDEIRDLREKIRLLPIKARKKVYIIDEVHMLTTDAFNALLKTLEEPPEHAMFIFCTTEAHKVPATILSRCFHVSFTRATTEELVHSFTRIAKAEKISITPDALECIASLSDGSFRDGAKILEELATLSKNEEITKELLDQKYKVVSSKYYVDELLKSLSEKNVKLAVESISSLVEQGIDMKYFLEQLIATLHDILLEKVGIESSEQLRITNYELRITDIQKLIQLFSKAHSELKYAVIPQLPLELAVIEYCVQQESSQLFVHSSQQTNKQETDQNLPAGKAGADKHQEQVSSSSTSVILGTNGVRTPESQKGPDSGQARMTEPNLWGSFIDVVKVHNHTIAGVLRGCSLKSSDDSSFVIETSFKFHKDKLSEQKALLILESALEEITGKKIRVLVQLKT